MIKPFIHPLPMTSSTVNGIDSFVYAEMPLRNCSLTYFSYKGR